MVVGAPGKKASIWREKSGYNMTSGGSVAGPGPVAALSLGSYRPGVAVAPVAGPLPALRRCRRAPTGTAGALTGGGSVAGPRPVAAPSPGSYLPGVAVASVAGPIPALRRCRLALTCTAGGPTGGGSVAGP